MIEDVRDVASPEGSGQGPTSPSGGASGRPTESPDHREPGEGFSCERIDLDSTTVVVVDGEIDLDTAGRLRQTIYDAIEDGHPQLLIDLTRTTFCGSSGLSVFVAGLRRARIEGGWIRLVNPTKAVRQVLHICYLDQILPIHDSLDEARAQAEVSQDELVARISGTR